MFHNVRLREFLCEDSFMKEQRVFSCEAAYLVGIVILAFGGALMEKADFGLSMVIAPAYLIHLKVSQFLPFYTFGMSAYVFQALLLAALSLALGKFKKSYLLSFVPAILYGLILDVFIALLSRFPYGGIGWRIVFYLLGLPACSLGVALLFHTYLPPEAYEVVVKEISQKFNLSIGKTKTAYDCCSCALGIALSFAFFGFGTFVGVKWGTVICALINGSLITRISNCLEKHFVFKTPYPYAASLIKTK